MRWLILLAGLIVALAAACTSDSNDATPAPVGASGPGGIAGTVTGLDGGPVAGMRIGIVGGTASFPEIAPETDQEGHYQFGGVPPGTFEVAVHDRDGQRIGLESVTVTSGKTAILDFSVSAAAGGENAPPASARGPTDGLCLPAVPLAVSVGDTWTISGPVKLPKGFPSELPVGAAEVSSTFTVDAIGSTNAGARGDAPVEHPTIQLQVTNVTRDADGNVLSTEEDPRIARGWVWRPASVTNLGPALTPDWECHQQAWLEGWPPPAQPSIGERVLSSGVTAVVFTVMQPLLVPDQGIDATIERHHGYDRLTGRVVLQEVRTTGTRDGTPFNMEMLMELTSVGTSVASSMTGPGSCQEYLNLPVSIDDGNTEEPAVATSYQCMSLHVDSTAQYPSEAPSLTLTQGVPLSLRLGVERNPVALELRLYSGAGIYGSFLKWPEELFFDEGPVDTLQPTPSLALQYLPQQSPGEYSLVVRATWDGPIDVFYAMSFRLR